jgi:hypothetical protein
MALKAVAAPLGSPVGGSGTPGTIPVWSGTGTTLGDSQLVQSATAIYTTTRNFGIGTATLVAGSRVDAAGTSIDQSGWGLIAVRSSDAMGADKGGSISFGGLFNATNETHWAQISGRKENGTSGQYGGYLAFATRTNGVGSNAERMRIDSSGNVILNTANTGATIQAAGSQQGLKLPATPGNTDPNTLDAYADGGTVNSGGVTWTPALRFGGATTGITGSQVGRYTRIGNMVFAQGTIALSSKGSATGAATIAGLPTSANVAATLYYSIAIGYNSKVTFTGQLHGLISVNSGTVELYQTSTAGVVSAITNTDFAADSVLTFSVCYPVT